MPLYSFSLANIVALLTIKLSKRQKQLLIFGPFETVYGLARGDGLGKMTPTACFPTPYATLNRYRRPPPDDMLTMSPLRRGTIIRAA